jgi:hypothetical protein
MPAPDMIIIVLAVIEFLAVIGMAIAAFLMYQRIQTVNGWMQPSIQESKAIALRAKATALETKNRAMAFSQTVRTLVLHVKRKVQTTTRLAREVVHPSLPPLHETARALTGPDGLARRLARLHEAGKIAAGRGNGHESHS